MSRGSTTWWCSCGTTKTKHEKGVQRCATPTQRGHHRWYWAMRVRTSTRDDHQLKRGTYATDREATADLETVRALLDIVRDDDHATRRLGDQLVTATKRRGALRLPDAAEFRRRYGAGVDPLAATVTLNEWFEQWLASKRRISDRTRTHYRTLTKIFRHHLGELRLDRIRGEHVADVLAWLDDRNDVIRAARDAGEPIPPDDMDPRGRPDVATVNTQIQHFGALRMVFRAAVQRRILIVSPCDHVEMPSATRFDAQFWDARQAAQFLDGTAGDRLALCYRLVLLGGLRRGEVTGLQWRDFSADFARVTVRRTLTYAGPTKIVCGPPKTDSSHRVVSLDAETTRLVREAVTRQRQERLVAGAGWAGPDNPRHDWVFARPDGTPEPPYAVARKFKRRAAELGLPVIRFHDGRHTHASLQFEAGTDIKVISERLGHSSVGITADIYTHVRRATHDRAADAVVDLVNAARDDHQMNKPRKTSSDEPRFPGAARTS